DRRRAVNERAGRGADGDIAIQRGGVDGIATDSSDIALGGDGDIAVGVALGLDSRVAQDPTCAGGDIDGAGEVERVDGGSGLAIDVSHRPNAQLAPRVQGADT